LKNYVALVTGANQGIGYEIANALLKEPSLLVLVGARDPEKGQEAVRKLNSQNAQFIKIDLTNEQTIIDAANHVSKTYGGLDILVNNAGIAWKGDVFNEEVARGTIATNYYGTKNVCRHFFPLIRPHGRVVNVSSFIGKLSILKSPQLLQQFTNPNLTVQEIDNLLNKFIEAVKNNTYKQEGWPSTCYGISKLALNALTRVQFREEKREDVLIFATCPGWCSTAMSSYGGPRTAAKGAETPAWLALLPPNSNVKPGFYQDKVDVPW